MQETDRRILEIFAARVKEAFPQAKIWAFGSRARGEAREDSDFDVCVVLEHCDSADRRALRHIAWEVAFAHGQVFNTLIFTEEEFSRGPMSASSLVRDILHQGVAA
ncbi:MAG: nucleotidyltransferase domain-containing protein [Candidatus Latescibacteria bacterium]|nr:nucleotidyltransferase domain-containing protein [Candidatus Latescibacterota bacterium]